ncbi:kinesin-like protein KIF9 [Ptychodera flava]|uniref:kinesin-like protein KIF9 n=1 Tax=Ptychodera flava TaxID=63121 RepID=UPI00396A6758
MASDDNFLHPPRRASGLLSSRSHCGSPMSSFRTESGRESEFSISFSERSSSPLSRSQAFEDFKRGKGHEINKIFMDNKEILYSKKTEYRYLAKMINATKRAIDETKLNLEKSRKERLERGEFADENEEIIEEEEYLLMKKLRDLKMSYRADYEDLQKIKVEIEYCQKQVNQCREKLVNDFEIWYEGYYQMCDSHSDMEVCRTPSESRCDSSCSCGKQHQTMHEDDTEKLQRLEDELSTRDSDATAFLTAKMRTEKRNSQKGSISLPQSHLLRSKTPKNSVSSKPGKKSKK